MKFWDSSAVVPLLVKEASTTWILNLYRSDPVMLVWWETEVECASALARLERVKEISATASTDAHGRLSALKKSWQEVQTIESLRESAFRLLRVHDLRAGDSLQLAAAIIASQHRPPTLEFVCLDVRLKAAARREGFVVPEENVAAKSGEFGP